MINMKMMNADTSQVISEYNFPVVTSTALETVQTNIEAYDAPIHFVFSVTGASKGFHEIAIDYIALEAHACDGLGM